MLFVIGVGVALGIAVGIVLLFLFVIYMRRYTVTDRHFYGLFYSYQM